MSALKRKSGSALVATAPLRQRVLAVSEHPDRLEVLLDRLGYAPDIWHRCSLRRVLYRQHITVWLADRICVALGLHPSAVYGARWYAQDGGR